jgi:hypothetical protein
VGAALELFLERIVLADSGTTYTPSTIEDVATISETVVVEEAMPEEGTDASVPEDTTEEFDPEEEMVEIKTGSS